MELILTIVLVAVSFLALSLGTIVSNRKLKNSCCSSIEIKGEKLSCGACHDSHSSCSNRKDEEQIQKIARLNDPRRKDKFDG